jgi:uncharacterized protein (UPF0254 family)
MTAIRESICPKLVNIKSVIDITPPEPEEMTQRAEHSDAKVASTTTAREGADREVFHRCSHGAQATARFQSNAHSSEQSLARLERFAG